MTFKATPIEEGKFYYVSTDNGICYARLNDDGWWYLHDYYVRLDGPQQENIVGAWRYDTLSDALEAAEDALHEFRRNQ